jgi:hypothetical protein
MATEPCEWPLASSLRGLISGCRGGACRLVPSAGAFQVRWTTGCSWCRMATQKRVGASHLRRKNASGVSHRASAANVISTWMPLVLVPAAHDATPAPLRPVSPDAPIRPDAPAARPPVGRRQHGFRRSHGPAEDEVKTPWLTLRCPADPSLNSTPWIDSDSRPASEVKVPKEPKSRRNPREPDCVFFVGRAMAPASGVGLEPIDESATR